MRLKCENGYGLNWEFVGLKCENGYGLNMDFMEEDIMDWRDENFFIKDAEFDRRLEAEILPVMEANLHQGTISSYDGTQLRYYYLQNPEEKASIVVSHGFCEFFGKMQETCYYFFQAGYSVFFVEYRGHGHSQRYTEELDKVHLTTNFQEYVKDLKALFDQVVVPNSLTGRYFLFGHSMGGAIATLFLETYPKIFERAVLSCPMIQANYGKFPLKLVQLAGLIAKLMGKTEDWGPGQSGFDGLSHFANSCSDSEARYNYVLRQRLADTQCQNNGGTFGWGYASTQVTAQIMKHVKRIQIPVLMFQAGRDTLVSLEAQDAFAEAAENVREFVIPDAKHEIMNGSDENIRLFYSSIFSFYEE